MSAAAGWYADKEPGWERYWDGNNWTRERRQASGDLISELPRASARGLDVAALILAIVFAPVGLVVGFIALLQARRQMRKPSGLAIAATVIGAIITLIALFVVIA